MKLLALNGGPRKSWNTATMLRHFKEGVRSAAPEAEVETVHLFDLKYTGCKSCFACKRDGAGYAKCAVRDDIHDLLERAVAADGLVLASPIYFHSITAQLRGFLERLWFPLHSSETGGGSLAPKAVHSAMIYTMNVTEEQMRRGDYLQQLGNTERYMSYHFHREPRLLYAFDTYQFDDYGRYRSSYWDESAKKAWREKQFPLDCQAAHLAGADMAREILTEQAG